MKRPSEYADSKAWCATHKRQKRPIWDPTNTLDGGDATRAVCNVCAYLDKLEARRQHA